MPNNCNTCKYFSRPLITVGPACAEKAIEGGLCNLDRTHNGGKHDYRDGCDGHEPSA